MDAAAEPSDGLVVFAAMWGFAIMLSIADRTRALGGELGMAVAFSQWFTIGMCLLLVARPRWTWLLGAVALTMTAQYLYRLPVASNNQTITFFMNSAIIAVVAIELVRSRSLRIDRDIAYERLRVVARALLAVMYFYGIFHKINTDFFDPNVSCAIALYEPLTRPLGLDQNILGRYGAIWSTFIVEAIAIVSLYWRRFFWVGLILGLSFHYVIPISGYSWYMDFSSLVLALYMLSTPREVSAGFYSTAVSLLRKLPFKSSGPAAIVALFALLLVSGALVFQISGYYPAREKKLIWHSSWLLVWAAVGGVVMVLVTRAALLALPYRETPGRRQPAWLYLFPGILFLSALSPYLGLKTESSIAMFSNLHTEGGRTNHLLLDPPPYLFDYQRDLVTVLDSSDRHLVRQKELGDQMVLTQLGNWLHEHPWGWVTFDKDGRRYERVTAATYPFTLPSFLERKLLAFKQVDFKRPKICTH